jgi:hypothetical protein
MRRQCSTLATPVPSDPLPPRLHGIAVENTDLAQRLASEFLYRWNHVKHSLGHSLKLLETRRRIRTPIEAMERITLISIEQGGDKNTALIHRNVREQEMTHYNVLAPRRWVNSCVGRHIGDVCQIISVRQQPQRLIMPRCFLDEGV